MYSLLGVQYGTPRAKYLKLNPHKSEGAARRGIQDQGMTA